MDNYFIEYTIKNVPTEYEEKNLGKIIIGFHDNERYYDGPTTENFNPFPGGVFATQFYHLIQFINQFEDFIENFNEETPNICYEWNSSEIHKAHTAIFTRTHGKFKYIHFSTCFEETETMCIVLYDYKFKQFIENVKQEEKRIREGYNIKDDSVKI